MDGAREYAHTVHGNGFFCRPIEERGVYLILIDHKTSLTLRSYHIPFYVGLQRAPMGTLTLFAGQ